MPQDFRALFAPEPDRFRNLFAPDEISEEEANRTLTPQEQAMVVQPDPEFGAGTARRMAEYQGMSPEDASAKYRAGWADTISNVYNTVTDPRKLASVAGGVVGAGVNAVSDPKGTARRIGNYYYENPDAAVTDAAFALFPGRQIAAKGFETVAKKTPSTAMPRASVRSEAELLKTGSKRMEEAKLNPSKVDADAIAGPLSEFREATKTVGLETPMVKAIAGKLQKAYTPRKPDPMSRLTGVQPKERPPVSLTTLHGYEQALSKFINGAGKTEGRINSQGYEAIELKKAIDKMIDNHPESGTFKIGKHEYHRGKMSQALGDIRKNAENSRQWQNGDEAGALSNAINTYLRAKKNRNALTPNARHKLTQLARDRRGAVIGGFSPNSSFGGNVFARAIETSVGLPGVMALPGHLARQSRNARILKEFERIQEELRAGGPVGK